MWLHDHWKSVRRGRFICMCNSHESWCVLSVHYSVCRCSLFGHAAAVRVAMGSAALRAAELEAAVYERLHHYRVCMCRVCLRMASRWTGTPTSWPQSSSRYTLCLLR